MTTRRQPAQAGVSLHDGVANGVVLLFALRLDDQRRPIDRHLDSPLLQGRHQIIAVIVNLYEEGLRPPG